MIVVMLMVAAVAIGFTLWPMLVAGGEEPVATESVDPRGELVERRETLYESIRDLDFEYAMGKLVDEDYRDVRASMVRDAARVLAEIDESTDDDVDSWIETEVARRRESLCRKCDHPRRPGDRFCGSCGAEL